MHDVPESNTACVAVWYRVLQCVAVSCSVLQRVAECCRVLQSVAECCSVLQCVAVFSLLVLSENEPERREILKGVR